jgi:hypothetical protein
VKSVRAGATETEGGILDVRNGPSGAITVTLSSDFCEVSGTVNDNSGPVAGATVILESPLNIRSMQADSSGTYHFMRVEPGKYRLVALEEGAVPPRRSEDLEDYEGVTENLDLRAGDKIARDLRQRPPDK